MEEVRPSFTFSLRSTGRANQEMEGNAGNTFPTPSRSNRLFLPPLFLLCVPSPFKLQQLTLIPVSTIGLFRHSPSLTTLQHLRETYDRGHPVTLSAYPDCTTLATSLIKLFFRSLPSPIFPPLIESYEISASLIRTQFLPLLSPQAAFLLREFTALLRQISRRSNENLMTTRNLGICIWISLVGVNEGLNRVKLGKGEEGREGEGEINELKILIMMIDLYVLFPSLHSLNTPSLPRTLVRSIPAPRCTPQSQSTTLTL